MKQTLYVMMGIPGSGKSTYALNNLRNENTLYISRDKIRFSLLQEKDSYFSKEKETFQEFVRRINVGLAAGYNVVADATHLNVRSRAKLFRNLRFNRNRVDVAIIFINTPFDVCIERNETRAGTKTYVPPDKIFNMAESLEKPSFNEYYINTIYTVLPDKTIKTEKGEYY